jgi:hypothetical protein
MPRPAEPGHPSDPDRTVAMPRPAEPGYPSDPDRTVPISRPGDPGHPGDVDRTLAIPRPGGPGQAAGAHPVGAVNHPANEETMILPAFVTGRKEPEPEPPPVVPARPQADGSLPASERGMLVFVAALLGVGTIAVVIMLGARGLNTRHPAHPASPTPSATVLGAPVAPLATSSPSPTPSPSAPSPTPSRPPTSKPPTRKSPTPTPSLLGSPLPVAYCLARNHGMARPPDGDTPTWTCDPGHRGQAVPFTPDQVCDWQYGVTSHAVVGSLADSSTWKCYGG